MHIFTLGHILRIYNIAENNSENIREVYGSFSIYRIFRYNISITIEIYYMI